MKITRNNLRRIIREAFKRSKKSVPAYDVHGRPVDPGGNLYGEPENIFMIRQYESYLDSDFVPKMTILRDRLLQGEDVSQEMQMLNLDHRNKTQELGIDRDSEMRIKRIVLRRHGIR